MEGWLRNADSSELAFQDLERHTLRSELRIYIKDEIPRRGFAFQVFKMFFGVRLDYVRKVSFRWIRYEVQLDATDQIVQNLDHDSNIVENSLAARLTWYLHDDCIVSVSDYARVTYTMYQYVPTGPGAGAGAVIPFSAGYILRSLSTSTSLQCVQVRGETRRQIEAAGNNLRLFWRRQ
ncbi:hypothetical protein Slin14017_G083590 [Septoria linicola]|nr:hypothetical protein Slin14017_G083590 [Septoria linicola]